MVCGFTGGRREKRSPNYLSVKNPSTEKREKKRERKKRREGKNKKKERTKKKRGGERGETMRVNS